MTTFTANKIIKKSNVVTFFLLDSYVCDIAFKNPAFVITPIVITKHDGTTTTYKPYNNETVWSCTVNNQTQTITIEEHQAEET